LVGVRHLAGGLVDLAVTRLVVGVGEFRGVLLELPLAVGAKLGFGFGQWVAQLGKDVEPVQREGGMEPPGGVAGVQVLLAGRRGVGQRQVRQPVLGGLGDRLDQSRPRRRAVACAVVARGLQQLRGLLDRRAEAIGRSKYVQGGA
jgi:hypothetical protein